MSWCYVMVATDRAIFAGGTSTPSSLDTSITISAFRGSSYGSSTPVKPLIFPARAALYSPSEQGYRNRKPLYTMSTSQNAVSVEWFEPARETFLRRYVK